MSTRQKTTTSTLAPILADFLTRSELAVQLDCNERTLDRWELLGTGPPRTYLGRAVLYRRSAVMEWIASQERGPSDSKNRYGDAPKRRNVLLENKTGDAARPRHIGKRQGSQPGSDRQRPG
jgi:hypothetical protein